MSTAITHVAPHSEEIQRQISTIVGPVFSMLDIGCGIRPARKWIQCPKEGYFGLDAHPPYLDYLVAQPESLGMTFKHWVLLKDEPLPYEDRQFDVVVLADILEHLERPVGEFALEEALRVTQKGLVVCSPLGWQPQEVDQWGMGGEQWQTHRSAWELEDFPDAEYFWKTQHIAGPWFAAWVPK